MTHSYVCMTHSYMWDRTRSYVWHDSNRSNRASVVSICRTWCIHMCDTTHSYMKHMNGMIRWGRTARSRGDGTWNAHQNGNQNYERKISGSLFKWNVWKEIWDMTHMIRCCLGNPAPIALIYVVWLILGVQSMSSWYLDDYVLPTYMSNAV